MSRERIISSDSQGRRDDEYTNVLRPGTLREMVGQRAVIESLTIAMEAARKRNEPLEHALLDGPPGLGKTTLGFVIANEMNHRQPRIASGPSLSKIGDLMPILMSIEEGDIIFIDEIHRLPKPVEECLYSAMEDRRVDITIEGGIGGRVVNVALKPFTLIGATTRAGLLTAAMRDRFGHRFDFEFYSTDDLAEILRRSAARLKIEYDDEALPAIAKRSRGTPRVANRLLRRVRDFAQVRADGVLTITVVENALEIQQVDRLGLDELDRKFLDALITVYRGRPAGIEAIAATMGQERDTLEDVVEPYLLQIGFLIRTRQGRQATADEYQHLGRPMPKQSSDSPTLFE
jgi:Holliday junction DNA helicase RuvB